MFSQISLVWSEANAHRPFHCFYDDDDDDCHFVERHGKALLVAHAGAVSLPDDKLVS